MPSWASHAELSYPVCSSQVGGGGGGTSTPGREGMRWRSTQYPGSSSPRWRCSGEEAAFKASSFPRGPSPSSLPSARARADVTVERGPVPQWREGVRGHYLCNTWSCNKSSHMWVEVQMADYLGTTADAQQPVRYRHLLPACSTGQVNHTTTITTAAAGGIQEHRHDACCGFPDMARDVDHPRSCSPSPPFFVVDM